MENQIVVEGNEIQVSMSSEIESKVQRIRELKESIAEKQNLSGITTDEEEIETKRKELLELVREYKSLTGENWSDSSGYARYVSPGESHKYDVKRVDEVMAGLLTLQAEMDGIVDDREFIFSLKFGVGDTMMTKLEAVKEDYNLLGTTTSYVDKGG